MLDTQAVSNIFINRFGKRVRTLENHANALAQGYHVYRSFVDVEIMKQCLALGARAWNEVTHAVKRA